MFKYETHMHTWPVSRCAKAGVEESLRFYKGMNYEGVFITNHFLDGNINIDKNLPYSEKIEFYFSDYEKALELSSDIGIKVFLGVEITYEGIDFLVYGLDKVWFLNHPEIMEMKQSAKLKFLMSAGALVIHAHPFREDSYIDHIHLFPRGIEGVEVLNACRKDIENKMADFYAFEYGFLRTAGTDNHIAGNQKRLAGMESDTPLSDEQDFIARVRNGSMRIFEINRK